MSVDTQLRRAHNAFGYWNTAFRPRFPPPCAAEAMRREASAAPAYPRDPVTSVPGQIRAIYGSCDSEHDREQPCYAHARWWFGSRCASGIIKLSCEDC